MCRLLCVKSSAPFALAEHLRPFAHIAQHSREYQGHGWGCSWLADGGWHHYHDIRAIWEDPTPPQAVTTLLVAHARSAFRDEGITVSNNMPFADDERVFSFNGELRGVRVKERGRIGAEKIFNYIKRFDNGDLGAAIDRGVSVIEKRSRYIRAMNFVIATATAVHVASLYNEDPDYFQLSLAHAADHLIICSDPYGEYAWERLPNRSVRSYTD